MEVSDSTAYLAAFWGAFAGLALILGGVIGHRFNLSDRLICGIMAFGCGVLIAILTFELMGEALEKGDLVPAAIGFLGGVLTYAAANYGLEKFGAKHRKRSSRSESEDTSSSSSLSIALGALLDGIPEAAAIGVSLTGGKGVAIVTVAGVFISNLPEGLSSTVGMKREGRSTKFIFGLWFAITAICAVSAYFGFQVIGQMDANYVAIAESFAAGAIFAMILQTMIPEAVAKLHGATGLVAAIGFLLIFVASHL